MFLASGLRHVHTKFISDSSLSALRAFLAELFQQLCSLNWKFFWPEISFEATGGRHISRDYEGGRCGQGGDDTGKGGDDARGYHMLSHPPGRHHTGGGTTRARGDDAEGGDDIRGHHRGWDNMWCPPCRPPSPASSPPPVWCLPGGWDNMWYPPCHPPSPASSPLARVVPPSVWCLRGGWDNMWYPPCHPPLPASSPLARVIPPSVWCLPGGWDNMWYPPCRPPLARVIPP